MSVMGGKVRHSRVYMDARLTNLGRYLQWPHYIKIRPARGFHGSEHHGFRVLDLNTIVLVCNSVVVVNVIGPPSTYLRTGEIACPWRKNSIDGSGLCFHKPSVLSTRFPVEQKMVRWC
jgi:hypothetical protein